MSIVSEIRARLKKADELRAEAESLGAAFVTRSGKDGVPPWTAVVLAVDEYRAKLAEASAIDAAVEASITPAAVAPEEPAKPARKAPSKRGAADEWLTQNGAPGIPLSVADVVSAVGCGEDTARRALRRAVDAGLYTHEPRTDRYDAVPVRPGQGEAS